MNKLTALTLTIASGSLFTACLFQNPDSQAMTSAKFEVKANATAAALAKTAAAGLTLGDTAGLHFTVTDAHLYVKWIRLESETESAGSGCVLTPVPLAKGGDSSEVGEVENEKACENDELSVKGGPFIVDLLTGVSVPDMGAITVPAGHYGKIMVKLDHSKMGDSAAMAADGLNGNTLVAKGTFANAGGVAMPFSLSLKFEEVLKIRNDTGMVLDGSTLNTIMVQLKAGDWLSHLDIARCLTADTSTAGALNITEDSPIGKCLDAEHVLKGSFRGSFGMHEKDGNEDKDGSDGKRDSSEVKKDTTEVKGTSDVKI